MIFLDPSTHLRHDGPPAGGAGHRTDPPSSAAGGGPEALRGVPGPSSFVDPFDFDLEPPGTHSRPGSAEPTCRTFGPLTQLKEKPTGTGSVCPRMLANGSYINSLFPKRNKPNSHQSLDRFFRIFS